MIFTAGAMLAGAATYGLLGAIGALLPGTSPVVGVVVMGAGCALTLVWFAFPSSLSLPSPRKQLNRKWTSVPNLGAAVFGVVLGIGLLTLITTPLVWIGVVAAFVAGSPLAGATYGLGFGLGRTAQVLRMRCHGQACATGEVALALARRGKLHHWLGATAAAALALVCLVGYAL